MSTLRKQLAAQLKTALAQPNRYRIVPSLATLDRIAKPTIQLEQADLAPSPNARGVALVTMRVHVITHREGVTPSADDSIDELGLEVFEALARIPFVSPRTAEKAVYKDSNLSYIITLEVLAKRSTP